MCSGVCVAQIELGRRLGADIGAYYSEPVVSMSVDASAAMAAWEDEDMSSLFLQSRLPA